MSDMGEMTRGQFLFLAFLCVLGASGWAYTFYVLAGILHAA